MTDWRTVSRGDERCGLVNVRTLALRKVRDHDLADWLEEVAVDGLRVGSKTLQPRDSGFSAALERAIAARGYMTTTTEDE